MRPVGLRQDHAHPPGQRPRAPLLRGPRGRTSARGRAGRGRRTAARHGTPRRLGVPEPEVPVLQRRRARRAGLRLREPGHGARRDRTAHRHRIHGVRAGAAHGAEPFRPVRRAEAAHRLRQRHRRRATAGGAGRAVFEPGFPLDGAPARRRRALEARGLRGAGGGAPAALPDRPRRPGLLPARRGGRAPVERNRAALARRPGAGRARAANAAALRGVRAAPGSGRARRACRNVRARRLLFLLPPRRALAQRARSTSRTRSCRDAPSWP